ncbi:MAG: adenylyl-sulfate kinase, partial [Candidatus Microthrix sp.]|nr:adenylyl-sulfate kinase [Candidatus Microthrix sp.]
MAAPVRRCSNTSKPSEITDRAVRTPFRMPVQWVNRPNLDFRGLAGQIVGGAIDVGDAVRALPSGKRSTVAGINTFDGPLDTAVAGQSVTLVLADEIDVSRGDVLCADADPPGIADQFEAHVVWMHDEELLPGRPYLLKLGTTTVGATLSPPKHTIDVNTLQHL